MLYSLTLFSELYHENLRCYQTFDYIKEFWIKPLIFCCLQIIIIAYHEKLLAIQVFCHLHSAGQCCSSYMIRCMLRECVPWPGWFIHICRIMICIFGCIWPYYRLFYLHWILLYWGTPAGSKAICPISDFFLWVLYSIIMGNPFFRAFPLVRSILLCWKTRWKFLHCGKTLAWL